MIKLDKVVDEASLDKAVDIVSNVCGTCSFQTLCAPVALNEQDMQELNVVTKQSRRLRKGECLFRAGERFHSLFAVRTGFFKMIATTVDGRNQITGFFMSGELLGLDGICAKRYACNAVALEDSEVCELPFEHFKKTCTQYPHLHHHFYQMMSQEIVRSHEAMLALANMCAEERLIVFLLNLSYRLNIRGFSSNDFILRMSREEIGSYLGVKLETVSRMLSHFSQEGWIRVDHKHIQLLKPEILKRMVSGCQPEV
ncbi:cyclic nucleotide-binding domain-containing protein [Stenoxybacter acetivorans]|uniref:cyclic nucleotide-binding domain-containing protein n=1 Tax=Stenoxybacter acetivorans TaxID=422441 RepID=UPI000A01F656|nr:cyclic nucleotide-binding domain-containing protein [Stenoxybacter acetivorans]